MKKIGILGAGSWGTALAINCARLNQLVYLWGHSPEHISQLVNDGENKKYLPKHQFSENLLPINDLSLLKQCEFILLVVPSHAFQQTLDLIKPYIENQSIGWAIKGFDKSTNELLSQTYQKNFPNKDFAILAGPSFAKEVATGLPTAITIAGSTEKFATHYASYFHNETMRTYTTDDVVGAQIGGALKNVIAIAAGIADGLGFGANTRAALITRGLREITRIGEAVGAERETLMGLSGLGDLLLTCTDDQSRNRRLGLLIGQGKNINEAQKIIGQTIEGISTTTEALHYAKKLGVRTPIIDVTYQVLQGDISAKDAVKTILATTTKPEKD